MSIYDETIPADVADIYFDDDGFAVDHDVDGVHMLAIVHSAQLSGRSSLADLAAYGADCSVIVRQSDYDGLMPTPGAIFFLDGQEFRVQSASRVGGVLIKISLDRVEG